DVADRGTRDSAFCQPINARDLRPFAYRAPEAAIALDNGDGCLGLRAGVDGRSRSASAQGENAEKPAGARTAHSITREAFIMTTGGTVGRTAWGVLGFPPCSSLGGCSMGFPPGFAPCRFLCTGRAACR